jgi:hypothetical protein
LRETTLTDLGVLPCDGSARLGERVSFPLEIDYNPLERMVAEGELDPSPKG